MEKDIVYSTFPNERPVPNVFSSILLGIPVVFHPQAFQSINSSFPDMLLPYLLSRELGLDELVMRKAYEQLLYLGYYNAAALLLRPDQDYGMAISHYSRFPETKSCRPPAKVEGITRAWKFDSFRDYEAEFDAWISADQADRACLVFLKNLADHYVLTGEHGRLKARLSALSMSCHPDLAIYRLYIKVRFEGDAMAAKTLSAHLDAKSILSLPLKKKIAFAEIAAACSEQGSISKCLPPELCLMQCHRMLQQT
jgi:hypothetical protein